MNIRGSAPMGIAKKTEGGKGVAQVALVPRTRDMIGGHGGGGEGLIPPKLELAPPHSRSWFFSGDHLVNEGVDAPTDGLDIPVSFFIVLQFSKMVKYSEYKTG